MSIFETPSLVAISSSWQFSRPSSCASSPHSSSPLGYRPRRHPRWRQAPLARSPALVSSLNERLICEPLSRYAIYEAVEPRQGVILDVAFVQPERKLVNVSVQMLRAGMMIDADQSALQYGENTFDTVCRYAPRAYSPSP